MIVKACDGYVNVLKYDSSDVLFGVKWIVYLQMAWHPPGRVIVIYISERCRCNTKSHESVK